jgi:hypothetical protein
MTIARAAGVFYLLTFVTGVIALAAGAGMAAANAVATIAYLVVTVLFYILFKPVNPAISLMAALVSLAGCVFSGLQAFHVHVPVSALAFFGVYCLLIGGLVFRSGFLPRPIGVLMMIGGLGWLTFGYPALARALSPYNYAPGIIGEGALTLWLLFAHVPPRRSEPLRADG